MLVAHLSALDEIIRPNCRCVRTLASRKCSSPSGDEPGSLPAHQAFVSQKIGEYVKF